MEQPPTVMRIAPGQDPARMRAFLAAHFAHERASGLRDLLVHLLAALGALVWVVALWPGLLGVRLGGAVLALWGVSAVATLATTVAEARWGRRARQLKKQIDAAPRPAGG